jgi:hypothetical protein
MAALSFIGFLFPLLFIALIVLVVAAVVGGRGEPDTSGRRPYAIYLSLVTFVGLMTAIGGAVAFVKALFDSLFVGGGNDCPPGFPDCGMFDGSGGSGGREVVTALLILVASAALTYLHGKKLLELRALEPGTSSPAARVIQVFAYAVCFLTVFAILTAVVVAATAVVEAVDPQGGFGGGSDRALSTLLTSLVIGALTALIFRYTWFTFELGLKATTPTAPPPPTPSL